MPVLSSSLFVVGMRGAQRAWRRAQGVWRKAQSAWRRAQRAWRRAQSAESKKSRLICLCWPLLNSPLEDNGVNLISFFGIEQGLAEAL